VCVHTCVCSVYTYIHIHVGVSVCTFAYTCSVGMRGSEESLYIMLAAHSFSVIEVFVCTVNMCIYM
jgi:hypothetical protein